MEIYPIESSPWPFFLSFHYYSIPPNYVHWSETPTSHLYTADLPGIRKEEIRVEVEDSLYLVIRTESVDVNERATEAEGDRRRQFNRKFRLPRMVDVDRISAGYDNGVLTVTVPRMVAMGRLRIDTQEAAQAHNPVARAA
ncbi:15.4 kDa class V heat shock protein [Typha angustifolia]|uniref:15.4 kDa class V heat shock protein n=1 Tax=Typha angustifolia TaxID=59011 RepID=UPI003C2F38A2